MRESWKRVVVLILAAAVATGLLVTNQTGMDKVQAAKDNKTQQSPDVSAEAYCIMDKESGKVILQKNQDKKLAPASITKILTALLVTEHSKNLDDVMTFSETAVIDIPLLSSTLAPVTKAGERMTVRDAMHGMMLKSANECANGLAEYVSGSIEEFVKLMNERLAEIGAVNTHFETPSGVDQEGHYTTAYDMALILQEALKNPDVKQIMSTKDYTIPETNAAPERVLHMGHQLVTGEQVCSGVFAGKTGYTPNAKWTLTTAASRNGRTLLAVTLKSDEGRNYEDAKLLLNYGFDLLQKGEAVAPAAIYNPKVTDMDRDGFTVTWHVGNDVKKADFPVWTDAGGNGDMTREAYNSISSGEISYRVKAADHGGEYGVYTVQAYVYDSKEQPTISTIKVLMTGHPIKTGIQVYEEQRYYVKENGGLGLNWIETGEGCYYAGYENGYLSTGFLKLGEVGYYMEPDGNLFAGWKEIDGDTYYFQPSGDMAVGFMQIEGEYYYFSPEGRLQRGFLGVERLKEIQNEVEKIHGYNYRRCR